MPSDQQKMYDYASDVNKLLSSDLPGEDIVVQIGSLVVRIKPLTFIYYLRTSSEMLLK